MMKLSKFKHLKYRLLIPLLIFTLGTTAVGIAAGITYQSTEQQVRAQTKLNAVSYGDQMIRYFTEGITVTDSLKEIIISGNGTIRKFDQVAADMMTNYIQSIQLAPDGIVTQIYPLEGNEAGLIDLIHDEQRGEIARYGRDHKITIAQGPFPLKQGGYGIAVRNPVYLTNADGSETFWGFTIMIMRTPDVFANSLHPLSSFGYSYRLSKTVSPLNDTYEVIDAHGDALSNPVVYTFQLGGCVWKMEVMPTGGWHYGKQALLLFVIGMVIILLLTGLSIAVTNINERRKTLKKMTITDSLTGLLNRHGFDSSVQKYIATHPQESCVGITFDIDDFKFINDMYGHATGDYALQQIADNMRAAFPSHAFLARNGGDEFCIFLTGCTKAQALRQLEQFMLLPRTYTCENESHCFSLSLGYALYPSDASAPEELFRKADIALYEVKLRGKNDCLAYEPDFSMEKRSQLGFALKDVSEHLPGAFLIYKADPDDERILFANYEMLQLAGCKDMEELMRYTDQSFCRLIAPDMRDETDQTIYRQIRSGTYGTDTHVPFMLLRKDGTRISVFSHGRIVDNSYYGSVFYVMFTDAKALEEHYYL